NIFPGRMLWTLCAGARKYDFLLKGCGVLGPELLVGLPHQLRVQDAYLPLCGRRKFRHVLFCVYVNSRDEDAVYALKLVKRVELLCPLPDRVPGRLVLTHGKDKCHVERNSTSSEFGQCGQPGGSGRYLDHAIFGV